MNKNTLKASLSVIALSVVAFSAQATNLVVNGDFELYTGGYGTANSPSQLGDSGTGGYTKLTGWTVGPGSSGLLSFLLNPANVDKTGSRDIRFNDNFILWGPNSGSTNGLVGSPVGGYYVGLDAAQTYRGVGISQTISGLTAGNKYDVGFYWAAGQQYGFTGSTTEAVKVTFGSSSTTTATVNLASHGFQAWKREVFTFTATSASQVLNFLSQGGPDGLPPFVMLDGVSVNATVPTPNSYVLLGVGLLGLLALHKKQQTI
jgi:hypothetical protein